MEIRRIKPRPIIFAADCEEGEDGSLICAGCGGDYADCDCLGPHNAEDEGYEIVEEDGRLVAYPTGGIGNEEPSQTTAYY